MVWLIIGWYLVNLHPNIKAQTQVDMAYRVVPVQGDTIEHSSLPVDCNVVVVGLSEGAIQMLCVLDAFAFGP